jgi:methylase of polypeptide subunit release factors
MQNKYNTTYEGFDSIVCNPHYVSNKANQNRITKESVTEIFARITLEQSYDDICKSIKSSYQQSKNKLAITNEKYNHSHTSSSNQSSQSISILKQRNGYLLFQLSAAIKAEAIVTSILKKNNFEVISCMKDHRGIPRCIVSKMR